MTTIFISYRRDDSVGHTGRLYDRLVDQFGDGQIFMDFDSIEPGAHFLRTIEEAVRSSDVLLAVIGREWLNARSIGGQRRLDSSTDLVRAEIRTALERNILVIPVLVHGATMPPIEALPDDIQELYWRNAFTISDEHFAADAGLLIQKIQRTKSRPSGQVSDAESSVREASATPTQDARTGRAERAGSVKDGPTAARKSAGLQSVRVATDGTGTHTTLQAALDDIAPGGSIHLAAGVYNLGEGVTIDTPVTLTGDGSGRTQVLGDSGSHVLRYQGDGLFGLREVTVRWIGDPGVKVDLVDVQSGRVDIARCEFVEAGSTDQEYGSGLRLDGAVTGAVTSCECVRNGYGISVVGTARPVLHDNTCRLNHDSGIVYAGTATGLARQNVCSHNEKAGISVADQSRPAIESNTFRLNEQAGILVRGEAQPTIQDNTCSENKFQGICIVQEARPILDGNTCQDGGTGIVYGDSSGGTSTRNTCERNKSAGIFICEQARPTIENNVCQLNERGGILLAGEAQPTIDSNTCRSNKESGIFYRESSGGTATGNTCEHNEEFGIFIYEQARPAIEDNTCRENKLSGLAYGANSGGTATANTCEQNEYHGIYVGEKAHPAIENNTCRENVQSGIVFRADGPGLIRGNTCVANGHRGIEIGSDSDQTVRSHPAIEHNTCRENKKAGIGYFGSSGGTAVGNTCERNGDRGIYIAASASPSLTDNRFKDNVGGDVFRATP